MTVKAQLLFAWCLPFVCYERERGPMDTEHRLFLFLLFVGVCLTFKRRPVTYYVRSVKSSAQITLGDPLHDDDQDEGDTITTAGGHGFAVGDAVTFERFVSWGPFKPIKLRWPRWFRRTARVVEPPDDFDTKPVGYTCDCGATQVGLTQTFITCEHCGSGPSPLTYASIRTRKTRYDDMPGGGVCRCLNPASPIVCDDCPSMATPTDEGRRRYPETNGHYDEIACTCVPGCADPCSGGAARTEACRCAACSAGYFDAIDYD